MSWTGAWLELHRRLWSRLPAPLRTHAVLRPYGAFLHRLVRSSARRQQYFATAFFRNRPQLRLLGQLADQWAAGARIRMAVLGCSNGAELYSALWTIRSRRPDLTLVTHAVDISREMLNAARRGVYSLAAPGPMDGLLFARITDEERQAMFDAAGDGPTVQIKPWLMEGITWHRGDAAGPGLPDVLGVHEMVLANNFLCHMDPPEAERGLRNIGRLVAPGGYLFVSGVDLEVRTRVARALGWQPLLASLEAIHEGDPSVRQDWPWHYWGLEPLDRRRPDRDIRYAAAFRVEAPSPPLPDATSPHAWAR